ncbi:MAG: hypothetical protein O2960_19390 [Verrucomicrobia bacterium]|nr:hypothetical protein [Verrucomicrobiota bacterium]
MQPSLLIICAIAFAVVLFILTVLAFVIRLLTSVFPDKSPEGDRGLMQAINKAVAQAYPGSTVIRVELETHEDG